MKIKHSEWIKKLLKMYIIKFTIYRDISWMVLILDIVSIHKDYILRLPGMLDITTYTFFIRILTYMI